MAWFIWSFVSVAVYTWPPISNSPVTGLAYAIDAPPELAWFAVLPVTTGATWLLLYMWWYAANRQTMPNNLTNELGRRRLARRAAATCIMGALVLLFAAPSAFVFWKLLHPHPIPTFITPKPNGLADILAAGRDFVRSPILSTAVEPASTDELAAEIAKYAASYGRLRRGLSRPIRARSWPREEEMMAAFDLSIDTMRHLRSAARGLMRDAELALQHGRLGDAARISLENFRLGQAITRDCLLVDYLVGIAIEGIGQSTLYQAVSQLADEQCREMIDALLQIERDRKSLDAVMYRDRIWSEHAFGWSGYFFVILNDIAQLSDVGKLPLQARHRTEAVTRLLIVELALRAFQLKYAGLPDRMEALAPEFLREVPLDPFDPDGRPHRYVRQGDFFVAYSVGVDGVDDGGHPPKRNEDGWIDFNDDGDLRLDVYLASESSQPTPVEDANDQQPQAE
jgi:hypothetical protein